MWTVFDGAMMKFKDYIETTCRESSIHGLNYLVKRELHWLERLFWGAAIISAAYFSINVCLNQWQRFRDNPIVYAMELTWGKSDFPYAGITLCSDFFNEEDNDAIVEKFWGVNASSDSVKYEYYRNFLAVLNVLRYDKLHTLQPYANDTTLQHLDFLKTLLLIHKQLIKDDGRLTEAEPMHDLQYSEQTYATAITEAGLCRTTSQLSEYTNPYGELQHLPVSNVRFCGFMSECNNKIFLSVSDETELFIYLHNVNDVAAPNDRSTIMRGAKPGGSLTVELMLTWTSAESEVRNLPIAYRKCRYVNENNLQYFNTYRPGLCRIECHINTALELCNCKPFFYAVAPHLPKCELKGLLCLARKRWTEQRCDCVPLCEEINYISTQSTEQKDDTSQFERTIIVKLSLPRMGLKRRVVFSTDQLIVSFGGAIGLFLGASFISMYGLIYILSEYVLANCAQCWRRCTQRRQSKSKPNVSFQIYKNL